MKNVVQKYASLLIVLVAVTVTFLINLRAGQQWFGSYMTVANGTGFGPTNIFATNSITLAGVNGIQVSWLTNFPSTNCFFTVNEQLSFDGTNFSTNIPGTLYTNTSTTAGTYVWQPGGITIPVYARFAITTTNTNSFNVYQP